MPDFGNALWAEELQEQWEKDRKRKATKKQLRAAERQAEALNPYPASHLSKSSRGEMKRLKRAEKKERRQTLKTLANLGDEEAVQHFIDDTASDAFPSMLSMARLQQGIESFLSDATKSTFALPPMNKQMRASVHSLAMAYNLRSKSRGNGENRFPLLYKTLQSGRNVNRKAVQRLVSMPVELGMPRSKGKGSVKQDRGGDITISRNREGAQVGAKAQRIGAENIGHQLLASMGWTTGAGLGSTSHGIAEPVAATVKISRGGLGF